MTRIMVNELRKNGLIRRPRRLKVKSKPCGERWLGGQSHLDFFDYVPNSLRSKAHRRIYSIPSVIFGGVGVLFVYIIATVLLPEQVYRGYQPRLPLGVVIPREMNFLLSMDTMQRLYKTLISEQACGITCHMQDTIVLGQ